LDGEKIKFKFTDKSEYCGTVVNILDATFFEEGEGPFCTIEYTVEGANLPEDRTVMEPLITECFIDILKSMMEENAK
jgi:hypothetical protein